MADFTPRSERRLYKATLVTKAEGPTIAAIAGPSSSSSSPVTSSSSTSSSASGKKVMQAPSRGMEKAAYLQALNVQPVESRELKKLASGQAGARSAINAADAACDEKVPPAMSEAVTLAAALSMESLEWLGSQLVILRKAAAEKGRILAREVQQAHQEATSAAASKAAELATMKVTPNAANARRGRITPLVVQPKHLMRVMSKEPMQWALDSNNAAGRKFAGHAKAKLGAAMEAKIGVVSLDTTVQALDGQATATANTLSGFTAQMKIQPVGRLHLERIHMNPVGVERGALVYSVPLAPEETINISHREWSVRNEEFEQIVQDSLEGFSEEGVTDKIDMAQATESQAKHATAINVGASLSASYSSVTVSSNFGMTMQDETEQSRKDSIAHATLVTRRAASRTRRDHKISFKVASASGTEDQAVRRFKNPSATKTMRVDYYELMRKWRVDLFRYGLRMTYDIAIPSPGSELIRLLEEIRQIDLKVAEPFALDLDFSKVTPEEWPTLAAQHQVSIDPPPAPLPLITRAGSLEAADGEWRFGSVTVELPDGYEVTGAQFIAHIHLTDDHYDDDHRGQFDVIGEPMAASVGGIEFPNKDGVWAAPLTTGTVLGRGGVLTVPFRYFNIDSGDHVLTLSASPRDVVIAEWRLKAWVAIRQAAEAAYLQSIQALKDQRTKLSQVLDQFDSLTLRRMEHEEVMKGVLRWLLGSGFDYVPTDVKSLFKEVKDGELGSNAMELSATNSADWGKVVMFGEFVKYIHQAIEWENMLYFPYPYFWDHPGNWPSKLFLYHKDPVHRSFLRAGSARVVLTVRPGYEASFAALLDSGFNSVQQQGFPYLTIAQEIEAFAKTNYPGIPPANGVEQYRTLLSRKQQQTWESMQTIMRALENLKITNNAYPTTAEGLAALPAGVTTTDAWGKAFIYTCPGENADYDLVSYGADGKLGGEGDDADIPSWAEASLVGRWFDYTPTTALDISLDTKLSDLT